MNNKVFVKELRRHSAQKVFDGMSGRAFNRMILLMLSPAVLSMVMAIVVAVQK